MEFNAKNLLAALGSDGCLTGGAVVAYLDRKHVEMGRFNMQTGVFNLTPQGLEFMKTANAPEVEEDDELPSGFRAPVRKAKTVRPKQAAVVEAATEDDLEALLNG